MEDLVRECLGFRLGAAFRCADRYFNRHYEALGLTHAHGQALACLLQDGELRIGGIAARTGLEASTVSRLVKELCRRKLVRRRRDPEDARAQLVSLGARGEAMRAPIQALVTRANARMRRDMPASDLLGLERACELMARLH